MTSQEKLDLLDQNGYIYWPTKGRAGSSGVPQFKRYISKGVAIQDIILDVPPVNSQAEERLDYPTQKPWALIDRIIKASSNEGDLVLDCFCGSGTTADAAEKLNRRWIACDLGRFAVHTTRKRLLNIPDVRPFVVQNLGKYERQLWQAGEFSIGSDLTEETARKQRAYIEFILTLYNAAPINGHTWLQGVKKGRMVHVGGVDAPVSVGDGAQIAAEFKRIVGSGKRYARRPMAWTCWGGISRSS